MCIRYFFQLLYIKKLQTTHFEQFIYDLPFSSLMYYLGFIFSLSILRL